jgi:hypothetical protein
MANPLEFRLSPDRYFAAALLKASLNYTIFRQPALMKINLQQPWLRPSQSGKEVD